MCFYHSTIIIRHPLCKLTRSSHSNVPQPQPTLKAKIDERSQRKRDIEGYWRHLETLDMFSCWSFVPIHSRHSWELKFDEKKIDPHQKFTSNQGNLLKTIDPLFINPNPNPNPNPCPTSNVDPTCDGRTQRRSVSLYSSSPWNSSHTLWKKTFDENLEIIADLLPLALPHHVVHPLHPRHLGRMAQRFFFGHCRTLPHPHHSWSF